MCKQWLVLIACLSFCGCASVQQSPTVGAGVQGDPDQPAVTQAAVPTSDEQPATAAVEDPPVVQDAAKPRSATWPLLGMAAAALFFTLLALAGAGAAL